MTHDTLGVAPSRVPPGWKIERRDSKPFKVLNITAPNGYSSSVGSHERNPMNVLYMLAEALLADGVQADAPAQWITKAMSLADGYAADAVQDDLNPQRLGLNQRSREALLQFLHTVAAGVPACGACPGDGTVCKTNCRLAEDSPTLLSDATIGALWRDLSQRGHAADYNDFWNIVKAVESAITHGVVASDGQTK